MADVIDQRRLDASRALNQSIREDPTAVPTSGHIVVALESDSLGSILHRALNTGAGGCPIDVAVYWPDEQRLERLMLGPEGNSGAEAAEIEIPALHTSIGMLCSYLRSLQKPSMTFATTAGSASLRKPQPA